MLLRPELIPLLARNCVNLVKVLRGVEIHGDRRADLEDALVKLLKLWLIEGEEIRSAAQRERLRHGPKVSFRERMRLVVRERMAPGVSARSGQLRSSHELPKICPDRPILVQLCLDLLHSSDFAEIEATDAELVPALQAALPEARRTFTDRLDRALRAPRPRLPPALPSQLSDVPLENGVRRFLDWLRGGGGPPSDGPVGSCPPPAVPV